MSGRDVHKAVQAVWRIESARLVAALARQVRDVGLAEELAQEALVAALERWEQVEQQEVFGQLEAIPSPGQRLRALFDLVAHEARSHIIYSELLKALDHPVVRPVIERVSARRLDYLTASFRQAGLNRADAQHRARLAYAAYVGFLQLNLQLQQPRLQHDEFEAYVAHVMATLIPA